MGLADRIQRLRDRIDPPREPSPDELEVLTVVPLHDGPMLVSALEAAGIPAQLDEVSYLAGQLPTSARVVVRHRDVARATALVAELRPPLDE